MKDLFLDIWVWPDGEARLRDEDEFEDAFRNAWVSRDEGELAMMTVCGVLALIEREGFPPVDIRGHISHWLDALTDTRTSAG